MTRPAPPRPLPPQDHTALDRAEQQARRVTWAVAAAAGLIALMVSCGLLGGLIGGLVG